MQIKKLTNREVRNYNDKCIGLSFDKKPNYMTVPASIRELEKIEMIKGFDGWYRLDHAVTKTQKTILKAFGMDNNYVRKKAAELSDKIAEYSDGKESGGKNDGEAEKNSFN